MVKSTFISLGLHFFFIILAYIGLPSLKIREPIELPIDIVEDTPVSSKTSLKLGDTNEKKFKNIKKEIAKEDKLKKTPPPSPRPKIIRKNNQELKKKEEYKEIAELIRKKPQSKIEKFKKSLPPKIVKKPDKIKKKQKENLAKGILNTLTQNKLTRINSKKEKKKNINEEVLQKIKKLAGNSSRQVQRTDLNLSQTDINKIENHVRKYFNVSYAASEVKTIITLKISANTDGTVKSVKIIDKSSYADNKFYRASADAARRAVLDSSPLPLPKGKEKLFENIEFDFNTSFINRY